MDSSVYVFDETFTKPPAFTTSSTDLLGEVLHILEKKGVRAIIAEKQLIEAMNNFRIYPDTDKEPYLSILSYLKALFSVRTKTFFSDSYEITCEIANAFSEINVPVCIVSSKSFKKDTAVLPEDKGKCILDEVQVITHEQFRNLFQT